MISPPWKFVPGRAGRPGRVVTLTFAGLAIAACAVAEGTLFPDAPGYAGDLPEAAASEGELNVVARIRALGMERKLPAVEASETLNAVARELNLQAQRGVFRGVKADDSMMRKEAERLGIPHELMLHHMRKPFAGYWVKDADLEPVLRAIRLEGYNRVGIAILPDAMNGYRFVTIVLAREMLDFDPFPRQVNPGQRVIISGMLPPGIANVEAHFRVPGGADRPAAMPFAEASEGRFAVVFEAKDAGKYEVEVSVEQLGTCWVAARFTMTVGEPAEVTPPTLPEFTFEGEVAKYPLALIGYMNKWRSGADLAAIEPEDGLRDACLWAAKAFHDQGMVVSINEVRDLAAEKMGGGSACDDCHFHHGVIDGPASFSGALLKDQRFLEDVLNPKVVSAGLAISDREEDGAGYMLYYCIGMKGQAGAFDHGFAKTNTIGPGGLGTGINDALGGMGARGPREEPASPVVRTFPDLPKAFEERPASPGGGSAPVVPGQWPSGEPASPAPVAKP